MKSPSSNSKPHIPHNRPTLGEHEISAVTNVINSNWLIAGDQVTRLEQNLSQEFGARYALAVNSGLSALHLALLAYDIGPGDQVIVPSYTCVALLQAIAYTGASPVVVDISQDSFSIDPIATKSAITKRTKAIIVPHTFGLPADLATLKKLNLLLIQDCAIAPGSTYHSKPLASLTPVSVYSFYATKMFTSAQGGAVLTNSSRLDKKIRDLANYTHQKNFKIRYNYRLTDLSASIANVQLKRLHQFVRARQALARKYYQALSHLTDIEIFPGIFDPEYNYYRFITSFTSRATRDLALNHLRAQGIQAIVPIQPFEVLHNQLNLPAKNFPYTQNALDRSLSIPIYPSLTRYEANYIATALQTL